MIWARLRWRTQVQSAHGEPPSTFLSENVDVRLLRPLQRSARLAVTGAVVAALAVPVLTNRDGAYPLSTYPMYASARGGESTFVLAQGVGADGALHTLTPTLIGNSDDPLIVVGELRSAVRAGQAEQRCAAIARRVARRSVLGSIESIEVVSERHDTVERTRGERSLLDRTVHAVCPVIRP